jgi:UDP-N-acetylmuramoyl-tripeptide--D-alanyl-D-alanine ligase
MKSDLATVARALGVAPPAAVPITGWSVDTRSLTPGELFFALRGENLDGHQYVNAAVEKGAAAVVVDHATGAPVELVVPDTLAALQQTAAALRTQWGGTVVGVTGSAGKTTTKDAIAHLLSVSMQVGKTTGNFNNHVGVPLSVLRLPDDCRVAVIEMGMNHAGEIRALAAIAKPEIGVVTNVGWAHVESFDSIDGVAKAKRELIEALPAQGIAVLNADDERVLAFREVHPGPVVTYGFSRGAGTRAEAVEMDAECSRFRVGGVAFVSRLAGRHGISNVLAAIAVAGIFGITPELLTEAVATLSSGSMRGERLSHRGITVWNDCYNANPEAMRAMIDVLRATAAERRMAVLGEMLELGHAAERLHREVGRYAAVGGLDLLVGVRGAARFLAEEAVAAGMPEAAVRFFESPEEAGEFVRAAARSGDAVLFKGSRGVHMERAVERFLT